MNAYLLAAGADLKWVAHFKSAPAANKALDYPTACFMVTFINGAAEQHCTCSFDRAVALDIAAVFVLLSAVPEIFWVSYSSRS